MTAFVSSLGTQCRATVQELTQTLVNCWGECYKKFVVVNSVDDWTFRISFNPHNNIKKKYIWSPPRPWNMVTTASPCTVASFTVQVHMTLGSKLPDL